MTMAVDLLRIKMKENHLDAYLIPSADPHQSEYLPEYWKIRAWITSFSGSAGTAVITDSHAGLWTDSRYFIQAENELESPFQLHRLKTRTPEYINWLIDNLDEGSRVGLDPVLFSTAHIEFFKQQFKIKNIKITLAENFIDEFWNERPPLFKGQTYLHDEKFAGISAGDKIKKLRNYLNEKKADYIVLTALDEISWLFNIRGNDIAYNPVTTAYALIATEKVVCYIDSSKLNDEAKINFHQNEITIAPYAELGNDLKKLAVASTLVCDKEGINYALFNCIPSNCTIIDEPSPVAKFKSIKNSIEIAQYDTAQKRDGIAMCEFINWLETKINSNEQISELDAAKIVESFRKKQTNYKGASFAPISAYQKNAALPHYSTSEINNSPLKPKGLYLIDSGGQYLDGTTDITRTLALGDVSDEQVHDFTLVLKGHIRLANVRFPKGTKGFQLDTLSRLDLWQEGKDFSHGTGHGIGFFLNVHEGPQGFSQATTGPAAKAIEPGMFITNEPGLYIEGAYGIRIENVLVCKEDKNSGFLYFETVSYCPIDKKLIQIELLTSEEIKWLNNYHKMVYNKLSPDCPDYLMGWLEEKTSPL